MHEVPLVEQFVAALRLPPATLAAAPTLRPCAEDTARHLLARWSEPHRRYHTVTHLTATLTALRLLLAAPSPAEDVTSPDGGLPTEGVASTDATAPTEETAVVELAAWFHDAVYTGRAGADEEASAVLAETELTVLGLPPARVNTVARLVRLTAAHRPASDDLAGQLLCDADLAILGASQAAYAAYTRAVREEYAHIPDDEFRIGRAAVLARLAAAERLYSTARGRHLWEARARANLAAELESLSSRT